MIDSFDDFCVWVYGMVDDIWQQIEPLFKRPGSKAECSDSELLTMALVGECREWDKETTLLSHWQDHGDLFAHIPSQSRFNRRRRALMNAFKVIRQVVLRQLDLSGDGQAAIDSLPVPVVKFHLVPSSTGDWAAHGADFGKVPSKKITIFGFKLHLLVSLGGLILDFALAPASAADLNVGAELLAEHTELTVFGDADGTSDGYISAELARQLLHTNRLQLMTLPRRNQKRQLPKAVCQQFNAVRQIIETVNGQLTEQFNIQVNHAHSFWGFCTRLLTKLAAHTLCICLNRLLGNPDFLHIKTLAFPI
jgi:Transposase DDE domain